MKYRFYILLPILLFTSGIKASHIVGGEISLQHISNNNYQIKLNLYFDLINGNPAAQDPKVQIALYDKATNTLLDTIYVLRSMTDDIPTEKGVCNYIKLQTRKLTYSNYIFLDPSKYNGSQGFYAAWACCCRNASIVNIKNPGMAATVFYSEFSPVSIVNSSPVFATPAKNGFACLDIPFTYDFSATDPDGELTYELVIPFNGNLTSDAPGNWAPPTPYAPVVLQNGITVNNLIPCSVPLQINQNTGLLSFTGTVPGLFVFSVRCNEYRNGTYLGSVRRDFQLFVLRCVGENSKPKLTATNPNTNSTYKPSEVIIIDNHKANCISLLASDTTQGQKLTVTYQAPGFISPVTISPNLYITKTNNDTAHYSMCIQNCILKANTTLKIQVVLTNENNCALPKYDTLVATINDKNLNDGLNISLDNPNDTAVDLQVNQALNFTVTGSNADSNAIKLYAQGKSFILKDGKMLFNSVSGVGGVSSGFSYLAECQDVNSSPYKITFITKDSSCLLTKYDSVHVKITVKDTSVNYNISLVNVITPNGDRVNDAFELHNLPVDNCTEVFSSIDIYNRWGTKVFSDTKRTFKWDASDVTDGVYYYLVKYNKQVLKSWLQVVR